VDRGSGDLEISLHVCLGRRAAIDLRVIVDESQILSLFLCVKTGLFGDRQTF
jgi:hypothetical protein